ncbi:hydrolase [Enterococcus faecium]|nr:hydrolase [Enterococcus faecium]
MFFEIAPCDSELNGRLTTSFLNGVQKLASAVISSTKRKIGGAIFVWLFLLLDAGQLFHNLFSFSTTFP